MEVAITTVKQGIMQLTLEKASKTDLMRRFSNLTCQHILQTGYPTIGQLSRVYPLVKVEHVLQIMVSDLATAFNGELTHQSEELAIDISVSFRNLTIEDVYMGFGILKKSSVYGKLTQNKVLKALNEQLKNRMNAAERIHYNQHIATKQRADRSNATELDKHKAAHAKYYKLKHSKQL